MNELDTLKTLLKLSDNSHDELLQVLLDQSTNIILSYCNIKSVPDQLKYTKLNIATKLYNQLGTEGYTSESLGGTGYSRDEILNAETVKLLNNFRRIGTHAARYI